jgi:hypothetical protein
MHLKIQNSSQLNSIFYEKKLYDMHYLYKKFEIHVIILNNKL